MRETWFIWLPTLLGFAAVYLLLPQVRRSRPAWIAALGAIAIILAGIWIVHGTGIWPETVLFYCFAAVAVLGGGALVTQSNPVHAALSFALVVLSTCGLFLLNGGPFLTAATIIIYAGAIVVTFLFVIMLAQQSGLDDADLRSREPFMASVAGFVLLAALLGVLYRTFDTRELNTLIAELDWLAAAKTAKQVNDRYRPPSIEEKRMQMPMTEELKKYLPETGDEARNYVSKLNRAYATEKIEPLREWAAKARDALVQVRLGYGTLAIGNAASGHLPRENVAALGRCCSPITWCRSSWPACCSWWRPSAPLR